MKPSLQLRLGQQLTMTPQLQQAIRLLQLSAVELQTEIQTALETNVMLELNDSTAQELSLDENLNCENSPDPQAPTTQAPLHETTDEPEEPSWENQSFHAQQRSQHSGNEIETLNGTQTSLQDYLLWQMQLTPFSEKDQLIAITIIDAINEDGYLTCSISEIVTTLSEYQNNSTLSKVNEPEVEAVLHHIQQFDPLGVGARNLSECLKIQIEPLSLPLPLRSKALELICHHLNGLAKHDYGTLCRQLHLTTEELQKLIQIIHSLNPRPGSEVNPRLAEYIVPDVFTYKKHGEWQVELNPSCSPAIQINQTYTKLIKKRHDQSADNHFLRHQLQEARWFLKSLENRNTTLLNVARVIVERQQNFLEYGDEAMRPLVLHDIASVLEMHDSTISRVTTQKYIHTPRGTFELKYFFSSHVETEEGGECSATAIRALIKKIIHQENTQKPLSDSKLAEILAQQGIKVARRTVAKYREAMIIPPSNERKSLA